MWKTSPMFVIWLITMLIFVPFAEIAKNELRKEGVPQSRAEGCGTQGGFLKWGGAAEAQPGPDRTAPTPSPIRGGSGGPAVAAFVQGAWGGCSLKVGHCFVWLQRLEAHTAQQLGTPARLSRQNGGHQRQLLEKGARIHPIWEVMESSEIVTDWSRGNITPILKEKLGTPGEGYKPVSLTSVPVKIMEIMLRHKANNLIGDSQQAFTKGKSCLTNLVVFCDKVTVILNEGSRIDITYLDLCRAYDTVPQNILASNLERHGSDRWTSQEVRNCLEDCTQSRVNVWVSKWRWVTSGIP